MRAKSGNSPSRIGVLAIGMLAGAVSLTAAACGSSATTSGSPPPRQPGRSFDAPHGGNGPFRIRLRDGARHRHGSFHGMAMDPALTAASHNPLLSTFAADAKAAGLTADVNTMHAITIFAPANTAFSKLPSSAMSMMHSPAEAAKILKYHVVSGRITPADMANGITLKTLQGGPLKVAKMGAVYEVNNADVTCGNIQTANATVYIINKVLMPMH